MKNAWLIFIGDLKRLKSNMATGIIVLGLIALPSIFSWYNMLASWDVFNNTGNLTVAVASVDEGYESDLIPVKINVGEQVISALRANDQINWVFTDEEDAIDGARSGKYYAAVVIPESFSRDMMTFYSDDVQHAKIVYYSNEKKNAISPKVTDQGADQVSVQVNEVFTATLSEAAIGIAQSLLTYSDASDVDGQIGQLADHAGSLSSQMTKASNVLRAYAAMLTSSQDLVSSSASLLTQAQSSAQEVSSQVGTVKSAASEISVAMDQSSAALSEALDASAAGYQGVPEAIDAAFASADATSATVATSMRQSAANVDAQIANYQSIVSSLEAIKAATTDEELQSSLQMMIDQLNASIDLMTQLRDTLNQGADDVEAGIADADAVHAEVQQKADEASAAVRQVRTEYDGNIKPQLDSLTATVETLSNSLSNSLAGLDSAASTISGSAGSISSDLGTAKQKLLASADELDASANTLSELSDGITEALANDDTELLREVLGGDAESLASALSAPVGVERHALYPVENFGSAMSPLYTTLALWIGALLIMVTLVPQPGKRITDTLENPRPPQLFIGRFGVVALLSLAQSTVLCTGNMFFLRVQVNEPLLYLLCYWVAGLVFTFIIYTLVVSFANFGKALAVILLIVQVAGGGGSFPLAILPQFFQDVSVWLPISHAVLAMRAAMFGVYDNDFWIQLGELALFVVPFILLGLVLRNPTIKVVNWFVEKVEESKVI